MDWYYDMQPDALFDFILWNIIICFEMSLGAVHWLFTSKHSIYPNNSDKLAWSTVVPTKSDSDVKHRLQLLSKTLTCTLHLSTHESIDHLCINFIHRIGLIHKWSILLSS